MGKNQREAEARRRQAGQTRLVVAWPFPGEVDGVFMDSVAQLLLAETRMDGLTGPGGGILSLQSGPRIAEARSQIVETFLTHPTYKSAEWLLMVDSDMVFTPLDVRKLIDAADPVERPIVGGLCFAGYSPASCYPTVYSLVPEDGSWAIEKVREFPDDTLLKVGATGAAFVLAHRSALFKMYQAFHLLPDGKVNAYPWFVEGHVDHMGREIGEDIAFCIRAQSIGIPIYVHSGVKIGHRKNIILTEDVWRRETALAPLAQVPLEEWAGIIERGLVGYVTPVIEVAS